MRIYSKNATQLQHPPRRRPRGRFRHRRERTIIHTRPEQRPPPNALTPNDLIVRVMPTDRWQKPSFAGGEIDMDATADTGTSTIWFHDSIKLIESLRVVVTPPDTWCALRYYESVDGGAGGSEGGSRVGSGAGSSGGGSADASLFSPVFDTADYMNRAYYNPHPRQAVRYLLCGPAELMTEYFGPML